MSHNYRSLSPLDFERLAADLLGAMLRVRFERFCEGPDGGIDLRYSGAAGELVIGQAKRYAERNSLLREVRKDKVKLGRLRPSRYLLLSSCPLTPKNKDELLAVLQPYCLSTGDIFGSADLDALLVEFPQVLRSNFKLWLHDAEQISAVLHNGLHQLTAANLVLLKQEALRFVPHPSVDDVAQRLAQHHCCIVTGNPGVGKTALASHIAIHHAVDGYELHVINDRRISDVWTLMHPERKQFFLWDDFLGATFLDPALSLGIERDLLALIHKVEQSQGQVKLLLTTHDYVLAQANWRLDALPQMSKRIAHCCIAMDEVNTKTRAEILCNHLFHSQLSSAQLAALVGQHAYSAIIRHANYTPRLIAQLLVDAVKIAPDELPAWLKTQLDNPQHFWQTAFRRLSSEAQCLLYVLAASGKQAAVSDMQAFFHVLYHQLHNKAPDADGLQGAIQEIEPNFARSESHAESILLSFSNPGIADLMHGFIQRTPAIAEGLVNNFERFEQGLQLFKLHAKDTRPIVINQVLTQCLLIRLDALIGQPQLRLISDSNQQQHVFRVWQAPLGLHLSNIWAEAMQMSEPNTGAVLMRLVARLDHNTKWPQLFSQGNYYNLLQLIRQLPEAIQTSAWPAAFENMSNSEDVAALAKECTANPAVAKIFKQNRRALQNKIAAVCLEEVNRTEDEDHLAAILTDIEIIRDELGVEISVAKTAAWEALNAVRYPVDAIDYDEQDHQLDSVKIEQYKNDIFYIDAIFNELVADKAEAAQELINIIEL